MESIINNPRIHLITLPVCPPLPKGLPRAAFLLYAPIKIGIQTLLLLFMLLFRIPAPSFFLLQNPPTIPTLPLAWLAAFCRRSKLIIDWHNYGYTILGLTLGKNHFLVKIAQRIEKYFGVLGRHHFCVTYSMQKNLLAK